MDRQEFIKYGRFLTSLISAAVIGAEVPEVFENLSWKKLFHLAKKHNVTTMIYPVVKNLPVPEETFKLFKNEKNLMFARLTRQNIEAERIYKILSENGIKFIKLKGAHIKDMYPLDYMRTFGDFDLCLTHEDCAKARPIMAELGYLIENITGYHDEYIKDNFYIIELHSYVVNPVMRYAPIFSDPFEKAVSTDDNPYCYVLKNEYLYIHLLCHLHNHFIKSGCGIRLFADFLIFDSIIKDLDYDFIKAQLKKYDMLNFYYTVEKLKNYFFYGKDADEKLESVAGYILENQTTGNYTNITANFGFWDKVKYFIKNWFPPAKDLSFRYPVLKKAPVLLPICWLRRIFYSLFFNRKAFKTQAESIRNINNQKNKDIREIRKYAENNN